MKIKRGQLVTIVDNETGKEKTGYIVEFTPERIIIETLIEYNAKNVHIKEC